MDKVNFISESSVVKGSIAVSGELHLYGKIEGNILDGELVRLINGAVVTGDVYCKELFIEGIVEGDVKVCKLIIGNNAVLRGKVRAESVNISGEMYEMKFLRLENY